jgi:hypothetical protein
MVKQVFRIRVEQVGGLFIRENIFFKNLLSVPSKSGTISNKIPSESSSIKIGIICTPWRYRKGTWVGR